MTQIPFSAVMSDLRSTCMSLCDVFAHPTHITLYCFPSCLRRFQSFPLVVGFPSGPAAVWNHVVVLWPSVVLMMRVTLWSIDSDTIEMMLDFYKVWDDFKNLFIFPKGNIIYFIIWFGKSKNDVLQSKMIKSLNYFMSKLHKILKVVH